MIDRATGFTKLPARAALALALAATPGALLAQPATSAPAVPAPQAVPAAAAPAQSLAQMPGVTVQYYDVRGTTISELRASMAAQRPAGAGGAPIATSSKWSIGASVRKSTTGSVCKVIGANARLTATVVMPRLAASETVPADVQKQWQDYVAGLEQQQIAQLRQPLSRLAEVERAATSSTCEGAQAAVRRAIDTITASAPAPAAAAPATPAG